MIEEPPDTSRLYVPLRDAACGVSLRLFRDRGGERCAVGFTRLENMVELLGPDQQYYRLTARSVRELAGQRDVTRLIVDPVLVAAPVNDITPVTITPVTPVAPVAPVAQPAIVPASVVLARPVPARSNVHSHSHSHLPLSAMRSAWERSSQAAGILVVSAGAGAAALMLEALK